MRVWGLCRKSKCPRPPVTLLPLSCSLGEAGGAGAEPPQNLPTAAAPVQTVLPLKWSRRKRGAGLSNPVPRFRRRNGNGKNPDSQGVRVDFLRSKKYYSALTVWIVGTEIERGLSAAGRCAILEVKMQTKRRGLCNTILSVGEQLWRTYNLNRARH